MTFLNWKENWDKDKEKKHKKYKENELDLDIEIPKVLVEEEYYDSDDDEDVEKNDEGVEKNDEDVEKNDEGVEKNDEDAEKNDEGVKKNVKEEKEKEKKIRYSYVDVYRYLYQQRYIFLGQDLTMDRGNKIIEMLFSIATQTDLEKPPEDVFLHVSCVRGSTLIAIALFDALQAVPMNMHTLASGWVSSVGALVLIGGGHRLAYNNARVSIHLPRPKGSDIPQNRFLEAAFEELERRKEITNIFMERTGQPLSIIEEDLKKMRVLSAEEAQKFGLIDEVLADRQNFFFPKRKTEDKSSEDESSEKGKRKTEDKSSEDESSEKGSERFWPWPFN